MLTKGELGLFFILKPSLKRKFKTWQVKLLLGFSLLNSQWKFSINLHVLCFQSQKKKKISFVNK